MDALRQWVEDVVIPWFTQSWPSIATGTVFTAVVWLLTFFGPADDED